jgi:hypothetical protein
MKQQFNLSSSDSIQGGVKRLRRKKNVELAIKLLKMGWKVSIIRVEAGISWRELVKVIDNDDDLSTNYYYSSTGQRYLLK